MADRPNTVSIDKLPAYQFKRINVVGTSGVGKTTTAQQVARRLGLPHVELDALHWDPNWTEAPLEVFRQRIAQALAGEAWVVDGNYTKARDLVWSRVELVVWLDYPLAMIMRQLVWRTLRRTLTGEELWSGNRERFREAFFSRESVLWWALTTYRSRRAKYQAVFARPQDHSFAMVRLPTPRATREWLAGLPAGATAGAPSP
jgi:adenylate kinase family enzyme